MRVRVGGKLRGARGGLFSEAIFGSTLGFGHVVTSGVVHPSVFERLPGLLGHDAPELIAIAEGRAALRGRDVVRDPVEVEAEDFVNGRGGRGA